jgi:hypothetical protein
MSDQPSSSRRGEAKKGGPWTYGHLWAPNPGYWGPPEPWRVPNYGSNGPMWGTPPMVPPLNYNYQLNQAQNASQGKQLTQPSSKSPALSGPKKRKVVEVALESQSKAGSQLLPVFCLNMARKILKHRLPSFRLLRGLSLLPNLIGRLNFIRPP